MSAAEDDESAGAAGQRGDADTAEDREHAAPGQPLALDDLGQVVGEAEVVVLELVVGAVVFGHAPVDPARLCDRCAVPCAG